MNEKETESTQRTGAGSKPIVHPGRTSMFAPVKGPVASPAKPHMRRAPKPQESAAQGVVSALEQVGGKVAGEARAELGKAGAQVAKGAAAAKAAAASAASAARAAKGGPSEGAVAKVAAAAASAARAAKGASPASKKADAAPAGSEAGVLGTIKAPAVGEAAAKIAGVASAVGKGVLNKGRSSGGAGPAGGGRGPVMSRRAVIACGLSAAAVAAVGAGLWWWHVRSVDVTVNGKTVKVHNDISAQELLKQGDYYGVAAGRLLSIGGNVLDEQGGERCTLTVNGAAVAAADFASTVIAEGAKIEVANGADVTEGFDEKVEDVAPSVQMERGGAVQFVSQWGARGSHRVHVGKTSGETVEVEVLEAPRDMVVASRNITPKDGKRVVALTFDDGPSPKGYTEQILDILKEKGAKATFFNLGSQASARPELTRRVVDEGHELASHTNAHQNLPNLDRDALRSEISSAAQTLKDASGEDVRMIRAPYGAFDAACWGRAGDLISCNVLWNIDTLDWKRPGAEAIERAVLGSAKAGSIVLMHDGGGNRSQDVEALPGIIDGLREAGFELVTVSELLKLDASGEIPADVIAGTATLPEGAQMPSA